MSNLGTRVRYRSLDKDELRDMVHLWSEAGLSFRPRGRDSMLRLKRQRDRDPELFLGAFAGDRLVGVALLSHDGRKGWINRLAVHPSFRHRGIAAELIARSERILRRRSLHIFCVHIEQEAKESMRLFEKSGYRLEDRIHYYTKRDSKDY
jgi:ribosomal protein S18 acetylase RimI-like enzyme